MPLPAVLFFIAFGFVPIGCLTLALLGWVPLHLGALFIAPPALAIAALLGWWRKDWGRRALTGLAAGILATAAYDMFRLTVVFSGGMDDFIPVIGELLWRDPDAHPLWGYLWRFLGNGGCMGVAFAMLPWHSVRAGLLYGTAICCCLFALLVVSPQAQTLLFTPTPFTIAVSLIGHWIYGAMLAVVTRRLLAPGDHRGVIAAIAGPN